MQSAEGESWDVDASTHREKSAFRLTKVRQLFAPATRLMPKTMALGHKTLPAPLHQCVWSKCGRNLNWIAGGEPLEPTFSSSASLVSFLVLGFGLAKHLSVGFYVDVADDPDGGIKQQGKCISG